MCSALSCQFLKMYQRKVNVIHQISVKTPAGFKLNTCTQTTTLPWIILGWSLSYSVCQGCYEATLEGENGILSLGMGMDRLTGQNSSWTRPQFVVPEPSPCDCISQELPMNLHVFHGHLCSSWEGLWARHGWYPGNSLKPRHHCGMTWVSLEGI